MRDALPDHRISYLDGLRGLAAGIVVICHFFQFFLPSVFSPSAPDHIGESVISLTPLNIFLNGNFAVCVFFVLSGFVLASPFFFRRQTQWYLGAALKRYPRLALPAVASTAFAWMLAKTVGFHYAAVMPISGADMPDYFSGITSLRTALWQGGIGAFFFGDDSYNKVLWTIQTELVGSFFIFCLVPLLGRLRFRWLAYIGLATLSIDTFYLGFVLGVFIADAAAWLKPRDCGYWVWLPLMTVGIYLGSYPYHPIAGTIWGPLAAMPLVNGFVVSHIFGAAFCLAAIVISSSLQAVLSRAWLRSLGRISYSMYLVHFSIYASIGCWLMLFLLPRLGFQITIAVLFVFSLSVIALASFAFCRLVDEPTMRLCDRLVSRVVSSHVATLAAALKRKVAA